MNSYSQNDQVIARLTPQSTDAEVLFKPVANQIKQLNKILICNTHNADVAVDIYFVSPDATPDASDAIFYQVTIPAKSTEILEGAALPISAPKGEALYCKAAVADKVNFMVIGSEMSL